MTMKQNQSSASAAGVAAMRAIETQKPESERICFDPYARTFANTVLPASLFFLTKLMIDSGLYDRMAPGATAFIAVRERYIDDYLITGLAEGLKQVVILGAGFDSRPYRIPGIEKTQVFEVDHPATQEAKLKGLKKVIDPLPAHVTFVPLDFNTQSLGEGLLAGGYDEHGKTLFIWQGVTYFLTAEGVDSTLAFIANHSGPGSSVIFDYFYTETLSDTANGYGKSLRRAQRLSNEAYMFGVDRGQIGPFLTQRGFDNVHSVTLEDLKRTYFQGPNARRVVPTGIEIVSARVLAI
jgi:methyltransferase (TIGR00027 family)